MTKFVEVARLEQLPPGRALAVELGRRSLALFNVGGRLYAIDDTCSHSGGPLSEGEVEGSQVVCPWHGARFELESGRSCTPMASRDLRSYPVRERDGAIEVEVDVEVELETRRDASARADERRA
jgi:3-phenylpropionate/trans-cinnamate dioxygenase ferredoxin component